MKFLILLGLALTQTGSSAEPGPLEPGPLDPGYPAGLEADGRQCPDSRPRLADQHDRPGQARRLGDLPPGQLELAVLRKVDGCAIPAIVREGLGAGPQAETGQR